MCCGEGTQLSISNSTKKFLCDHEKEFYSSSKTCPASSTYMIKLEYQKQSFVNSTVNAQVSNFY